jgi:hypothetical protein
MTATTQTPSEGDTGDVYPPAQRVADRRGEADTAPGERAARHPLSRFRNPGFVAFAVWVVALPIVYVITKIAAFDPFSNHGWNTSLALGLAATAVLLAVAVRISASPTVAGVAAGAWAAWVALFFRTALAGTPFAFGGMQGDAGRVAAMATRYSATPFSADAFVQGVPSEYPMFFPWVVGRTAALLGLPGWRLLADFEILAMSGAVLVAFLLWRRLVPAWAAFGISALTLLAFGDPRKAYEVLTLAVFIPWALSALGRPPRGRMHWLLAGVLGGFVVMTYQGWYMFGLVGLVGLIVVAWRAEPDRRAYVLHVLKVAATSAVVASWYLVPYIYGVATIGARSVADTYVPGSLHFDLFPFLSAELISVVEVVGLVGLLWLRKSVWWASSLLLLGAGAFTYRIVAMLYFGLTRRTLLLHYTEHMYETVLVIAGVLVVAHVAPLVLARLQLVPPRGFAAALLAIVVAVAGYVYSAVWFPSVGQPYSHYVAEAHNEPLPGEGFPRFAKDRSTARFPVTAIQQAVEAQTGPNPDKVTLATDERLYAYLPWPGYLGLSQSGTGSLVHWQERYAEVKKLAGTSDPAQFADASKNTAFGPIDVFVLKRSGNAWLWRTVRFTPTQFDPASWTIVDTLPDDVVVAIRK